MGDNRILAIAGDDDQLWVGGDDKGVALFDTNGLVSSETFLTADGLPSNRVRALSLDAAGDVWAATQAGVARYKRDVEAWIPMTASAGLDGLTDLVAVSATTDGGDRVVVVAGNDGVALLGPP
jgi:ligand-binding sensor domain-containing protein